MKLKDYHDTIQNIDEIKRQVHEYIDAYIKCRTQRVFIGKIIGGKFNRPSFDSSLSPQMKRYEKDLRSCFDQSDNWEFEWDSISMTGSDSWGYGGHEDYDFQIEGLQFFFNSLIRETRIADVEKKFKVVEADWKKEQKTYKAKGKAEKDTAEHAKYLKLKKKYEG